MYEKKNLSPPNGRGKMKKLSQTLSTYNSQMRETILLKFGMWGTEGGGRLHYKNDLSSTREHGATYA